MRNRLILTGALTLAGMIAPHLQAWAITNGVIIISTRAPQDTAASVEYYTDEKGPGMASPGDVEMANILSDNGYTCRLVLDKILGDTASAWCSAPVAGDTFYNPVDPTMAVALVIMSGSGASADTPPPPPGIPVMMGEHVCLGNNPARPGALYMYTGTASNDPNQGTVPAVSHYMKVLAPSHPIMQGIPLDAQGRVKIFRDPYPEESAHVPSGGKLNYEWRWCTQATADAAPCTTVIGVIDGAEDRACFAVADLGGVNALGNTVSNRLVHMFTNEQGSGGPRRVFKALTEWGRIIFVRAAKWAMMEDLQPYQSFRILDVSPAGLNRIKLSWEGSRQKNYRIFGTTDFANWQLVLDDLPGGVDGTLSRTLDIAAAPQSLFLRVAAFP